MKTCNFIIIKQVCLVFIYLVRLTICRQIKWEKENWAMDCDFNGGDFRNVPTEGKDCGSTCFNTPGCTHFTWNSHNGGTCWMKSGGATRGDAIINVGCVCGIVNRPTIKSIKWEKENWAYHCTFDGNDLRAVYTEGKDCGPTCSNTPGCSHFTWNTQNGGTCWLKSGTVKKENAIIVDKYFSVCGLIDSDYVPDVSKFDVLSSYRHPCDRDCSKDSMQMDCYFFWVLESYTTLSKDCFDCPYNISDCLRPQCISGNGYQRPVMSVNRMIPGPAVQVCQNDVINVIVKNELHEGTSIHWHGMLQKGTPHMDGVSLITQCPINYNNAFEYRFQALDSGTHFYHAHSGLQRADGIFGSLIIRERNDKNRDEYDEDISDHVIILNDWFLKNSAANTFTSFANDNKNIINMNSILINGKGSKNTLMRGKNFFATPRAVFKVQKGKRYRFRLINAGVINCPIEFSIENHLFDLIATDGQPLKKIVDLQAIVLYAGERFDIVIHANQNIDNYWIRAKGYGSCASNKAIENAILNYNSISLPKPTAKDLGYDQVKITKKQFNNLERNTQPSLSMKNPEVKGNLNSELYQRIRRRPDRKFFFEIEYKYLDNPAFNSKHTSLDLVHIDSQVYTPQINNISMEMPSAPLLSQWNDNPRSKFCNQKNQQSVCTDTRKICKCIHYIQLGLNELVEFIIVDVTITRLPVNLTAKHPMHLHGYKYAVLAVHEFPHDQVVSVDLVKNLDSQGKIKRNFDSPPVKDTLPIPHGGYSVIRFVAKNPGVWMFHCHIDIHSELGMMMIIKVGSDDELPKIPVNWPKCGNFVRT